MLQLLGKWIAKILSDAHSAFVGLFVVAIIGALIAWPRNPEFFLFELLKLSIPLWSSILLVLCSVALTHSIVSRLHNPLARLPYKIRYFDVVGYRWKVKIHRSDYFEIEDIPLCIEHDLSFVPLGEKFYCPVENENGKYHHIFFAINYLRFKEEAKSHIDKIVRDEFKSPLRKIILLFKK